MFSAKLERIPVYGFRIHYTFKIIAESIRPELIKVLMITYISVKWDISSIH